MLEGKLQRACADRLHGFGHKLHLTALLIHAQAAADQDMKAIFRPKAEKHDVAAEKYDGELRLGVLEGEVDMARGCWTEIGDLAFDPNVTEFLFYQLTYLGDQLVHGPDVARGPRLVKPQVQLRRDVQVLRG
ncbi:hypothetical protein SBA5_430016 [Candidatus Sulfotelmatomonas gaucii]|uniref:Uncharacterized protein n=1 Tax=Candidatus Sulfuritelmatomonas gaucii TaxID=2043161 RepID=A0A2N9LLM5_9BACT|nr:hypothetical protein SBA5_430016 [Candidatus Sulfotelmatomonas gaucii]